MTQLIAQDQEVETVFELVGKNENAMAYNLGWMLAKCKGFCQSFARLLEITDGFSNTMYVRMQDHSVGKDTTDIELIDPGKYHIIIKLRRGFNVPNGGQLEKDARRLHDSDDLAARKILVVLAESDRKNKWLPQQIPASIKQIAVKAISWREVQRVVYKDATSESIPFEEKRLLRPLVQYLGKVTTLQNQNSNIVHVVPLNINHGNLLPKYGISLINVVEKFKKYYHPVGSKDYPTEPSNYIAFHYDNKLQSIHHVESYKVIENFREDFNLPEDFLTEPHYLYNLGPAIKSDIPTNDPKGRYKITKAGHTSCFIDLLLTCGSIAEAEHETKKRRKGQNSNMVYVVTLSINHRNLISYGISHTDMVEKFRKYYYPAGSKGYLFKPPNYIAFRYIKQSQSEQSRLQSIHHVESCKMIENLREDFNLLEDLSTGPYYLYKLGPAIKSGILTNNGRFSPISGPGRTQCFIDLLLTCESISEAKYRTKKRQELAWAMEEAD